MKKIILLLLVFTSIFSLGQNRKIFKDGPVYTYSRAITGFPTKANYEIFEPNRGCKNWVMHESSCTLAYPVIGSAASFCSSDPVYNGKELYNAKLVAPYSYTQPYEFLDGLAATAAQGHVGGIFNYFRIVVEGVEYDSYTMQTNIIKSVDVYNRDVKVGTKQIKNCSSNITDYTSQVDKKFAYIQPTTKALSIQVVEFEWSGLPTETCINSPSIDLRNFITSNEGLTGATFSGLGVTNGNTFNPSIAGLGTHKLRVEKAYDNGTATKEINIVVNDYNRESYFDVSTITVCSDLTRLNLDTVTKAHPNGVWSDKINNADYLNGSNYSVITAFSSTPNPILTYAWTNSKGCTNSQDFTFTIAPTFTIPVIPPINACDNNRSVNLSTGVTPTGGTWTATNPTVNSKIIGASINVVGISGADNPGIKYPISYTVNKSGCIKTRDAFLVIQRSDVITTNYPKNTGQYGDLRSTTCNDLTNLNIMNGVNPKRGKWDWITPSFDKTSIMKTVLTRDSILNTIRLDSVYTKSKAAANCGPQPCEFRATYSVTNVNKCTSETSVIFFVNKRPAPPITTGASACVNTTQSASFTLTASSASVANYNLYWYSKMDTAKVNIPIFSGDKNQLTFNTPTIDTTTNYYARNKDLTTGCFSAYDTATATVNTIPTVNAGPNEKICQNVSSLQLSGASATIGSNPATGSSAWGGLPNVSASGVFTNSFLPLGDYIVNYTYTTTAKCANSAVKTITVVDYPRVVVGQDNFVCGNIGSYKLNGRGESPVGGTWSMIDTKFAKFLKRDSLLIDSLKPLSSNSLIYTFTNADNCTNFATRNVTLYEVPTKPQLVGGKVCGEGAVSLTALNAKTSENYMWYDSLTTKVPFNQTANFTTPSLLQSRYYFVSKKNLSGCEGKRDSVLAKVVAFTPVTVNGGEEIQVCKSANNTNLGSLVNPKNGKFSFSGISMLNDTVLVTSTANIGLYPFSYSFVNVEGCTTKVDNNVRVSLNPTLVLQNDTTICKATKSFVLKTNVAGGKWSGSVAVDSVGNFDPTKLSTSGNYNLNYVFNKFGCNVSGSTKINLVERPLSAILSGVDASCENDTLTFIASSNESGVRFNFFKNNDTIPFSNSITTKIKNVNLNKISVDAVNSFGCPSLVRTTKDIVSYKLSAQISATPSLISKGQYSLLESTINVDPLDQVTSYEWNFGDSTNKSLLAKSYHYYYDTGYANVKLKILTQKGCKLTVSNNRLIKVLPVQVNVSTDANGSFVDSYIGKDNYIRFYPNPVNNTLNMSAYNALSFISVQILNTQGYEVHNAQYLSVNELSFDLTNQPSGLYFVIINDGKGATIKHKIIKQ